MKRQCKVWASTLRNIHFLSMGLLSLDNVAASLGLSAEENEDPAMLSGRGLRGEVLDLRDTWLLLLDP